MIYCASEHYEFDRRFKKWVKKVSSKEIDLTKNNGYCLTSEFQSVDDSIVLKNNEYIVIGCEIGSRNHHGYDFTLINSDGIEIENKVMLPKINFSPMKI